MALYKNNKFKNRPSLLKELGNNGYYTKVVFGKDFFKSENVYKRLGVDEYKEDDDKKYKFTGFAGISYLTLSVYNGIIICEKRIFYGKKFWNEYERGEIAQKDHPLRITAYCNQRVATFI